MWVSWKHQHTDFSQPTTFEDKVAIFHEKVWGWQLHIAELCLEGGKDHDGSIDLPKIPHSAFAALQIMLSYFEMIAKYENGFIPSNPKQGESAKYFKLGVKSVFPQLLNQNHDEVNSFLETFYEKARCGLYHMAQTESGLLLTGELPEAMMFDTANKTLIINPHWLPAALKAHLESYRIRLLNTLTPIFARNLRAGIATTIPYNTCANVGHGVVPHRPFSSFYSSFTLIQDG